MQRVDPVFGSINFGRTFGIVGAGFWDGETDFQPLRKPVKVRIVAGRKGPSDHQRDFYREIEGHYPALLERVKGILINTPLKYFGQDFFGNLMPELAWEDFQLESVNIPKISPGREVTWSLSYHHLPLTQFYSVCFEDWTPFEGVLDD